MRKSAATAEIDLQRRKFVVGAIVYLLKRPLPPACDDATARKFALLSAPSRNLRQRATARSGQAFEGGCRQLGIASLSSFRQVEEIREAFGMATGDHIKLAAFAELLQCIATSCLE